MRKTWKVARLIDTDVHVHVTFPLIVAWFIVLAKAAGHHGESLGLALGLFALACLCLLAHEFGHVLAARHYGIATREVTLLPIGAVSRLERNPANPTQDLIISAAGPAVSIALVAIFYGCAKASPWPLWTQLFWTNVIIVAVNLIPAIPMDGGKLIKAGLSLLLGPSDATRIAALLSYFAGAILLVYGFRSDWFFVLLSVIVVYCAWQEIERLKAEELAKDPVVRTAVVAEFDFVSPDAALVDVLDSVLTSSQRDMPVLEGAKLCGIVTREAILKGLEGGARRILVREIMSEEFAVVHIEEKLAEALAWMLAEDLWVIPVTDGEQLVGILRLADAEAMQLQHAAQADALRA